MDDKKNMRKVVEEVNGQEPPKIQEPVKEEVKPIEDAIAEKPKESSFNVLWILIPGMLLLGLLIGGIFAYVFGIQKISNPKPEPTQEAVIETTATPSAKPQASPSASLTKYKIKILNGSGIKGEAGKVQTLVETAGFTVLSTGNASTYDFTKTQISIKTGVDPDFITSLEEALQKSYQLADTKTVSSQTNDVTITVGNLKAI